MRSRIGVGTLGARVRDARTSHVWASHVSASHVSASDVSASDVWASDVWAWGAGAKSGLFAAITAALLALSAPALAADGKTLFGSDCGLCHQSDGNGVPGSFPRLAGRFGLIAAKPEGKTYITHVLAFGMSGTVTVDDHMIVGYMPAFGQVPPADLAAILTYVSGLGGTTPVPFTADEIATGRKAAMTPLAVHQERDKLVAAKIVP